MAKDRFHSVKKVNRTEGKSATEKGVELDPAKVNMRLTDVVLTKDDLYNELANDWAVAETYKDRLSPKRQVRILEKALTAPAFLDQMIPLRPNDEDEAHYFLSLQKVKDTVIYLTEMLYTEMQASELARKEAKVDDKT